MDKVKATIIIVIGFIIVTIATVFAGVYFGNWNWPVRFEKEFDQFFGEGNWECIESERKKSSFFSTTTNREYGYTEEDGTYWNWDVEFQNTYGETEVWTVTSHSLLINQDNNWIFSDNRLTSKQGMIAQLYDIASGSCVSNDVIENIMKEYMTDEMIECFQVELSHVHGYPDPSDYDTLLKEDWFNIEDATLEKFLQFEEHEYNLQIFIFDYKYEELSSSDQQAVLYAMGQIESALLEEYGSDASFELYFGEGYEVEYENGVRMSE